MSTHWQATTDQHLPTQKPSCPPRCSHINVCLEDEADLGLIRDAFQ
jgi:hypothetical protein